MEHFTDDVDYRAVSGAPDDIGPIHGKTALRAWLHWFDMFDGFRMELLELIDRRRRRNDSLWRCDGNH